MAAERLSQAAKMMYQFGHDADGNKEQEKMFDDIQAHKERMLNIFKSYDRVVLASDFCHLGRVVSVLAFYSSYDLNQEIMDILDALFITSKDKVCLIIYRLCSYLQSF